MTTTDHGRRRAPKQVLLRDGPFAGREVPDTLQRTGHETFVVSSRNPASGVVEDHEYGLIADGVASWMGAVEHGLKP